MIKFLNGLDFAELYKSISRDAKSVLIIFLFGLCIFFINGKSECQEMLIRNNKIYMEQRIEDGRNFRNQIIKEIRRQVTPMIYDRIDRKTREIETKVDSVGKNINELTETIKQSL